MKGTKRGKGKGKELDRDKWPWEMAGAAEPAYETALSAALTQTDRPTGLCYHSNPFRSCLILPLFIKKITYQAYLTHKKVVLSHVLSPLAGTLQPYLLLM